MHPHWRHWIQLLSVIDENPHRFITWLLQELGIEEDVRFHKYDTLNEDLKESLEKKLHRLRAGEPISKILQSQYFYSRRFKTTADTLDPRPETQMLIDQAKLFFEINAPHHFLDLGTGTGCVVITLLLEFPHATGVCVDVCPKALDIAKENAQRHGVEHRLQFIESSWFQNVPQKVFDGIFSNPPYIENAYPLLPCVVNYDPALALFGGEDGCDPYRVMMLSLKHYSDSNSVFFFEMGYNQKEKITEIAIENNLKIIKFIKDNNNKDRMIILKNHSD